MRLLPALLLVLGLNTAQATPLEPTEAGCQVAGRAAHLVVQAREQGLDPISASALVAHRLASPDFPSQALWALAFLVYSQAPAEATPSQAETAVLEACRAQLAPSEGASTSR